tara:strand:- start:28 stop:198 length:171 start_codon:yes stop_codon:yes gene_type:complete
VTYLIWAGSTNLWEIFTGSFLLIIVTLPALMLLVFDAGAGGVGRPAYLKQSLIIHR